jgi:hypothetical protein
MAGKQLDVDLSTPIGDLLEALKHDGESVRVAIKGQPIVLAVRRERETAHLTPEEKMKLVQAAFVDTPSEIATFDSELERFKSPLDYE